MCGVYKTILLIIYIVCEYVFYTLTRTLLYQNTLHIRYRVLIGCLENEYKNCIKMFSDYIQMRLQYNRRKEEMLSDMHPPGG